jgi:hypothetical protein
MAVICDPAKTYPRRMWMKRTILALATMLVVFVALFAVLVLRPVRKVKALPSGGCSNWTLHGWYGVTAQGYFINPGVPDPPPYFLPGNFSMLAEFCPWAGSSNNFQGKDIKVVYLTPIGSVNPSVPDFTTGGTYTVNPDCTVTFTTPHFSSIDAAITGYGTVLSYLETSGNLISLDNQNITGTFDAKPVEEGGGGSVIDVK